MPNERFIIKYCNILDSVFVLDTLKRMPLTMVISNFKYVHGLDCDNRERAEQTQRYYENLCGYQRSLFQEIHSFTIRSSKWLGHYAVEYTIFDNLNNPVLSSFDKSIILNFKKW